MDKKWFRPRWDECMETKDNVRASMETKYDRVGCEKSKWIRESKDYMEVELVWRMENGKWNPFNPSNLFVRGHETLQTVTTAKPRGKWARKPPQFAGMKAAEDSRPGFELDKDWTRIVLRRIRRVSFLQYFDLCCELNCEFTSLSTNRPKDDSRNFQIRISCEYLYRWLT